MAALYRRLTAEFLGTFALVFFGCGAVVMDSFPGARWGVQGIAMVHAVILAIAVSATMGISGGHLNPAVTAGLAAVRRISPKDAAAYIGAQLVGAVVAVLLLKSVIPASVARITSWGTPALASQMTFSSGVILEAILTFMLMSAVMGTAVLRSAPKIGGFGIGLTLIPAIMIGGPLTGAALNPARAFGPALVSGTFTAQAMYWIGPIVGAVIAALVWQKVLVGEEEVAD
jgi:MIP family channel proteins